MTTEERMNFFQEGQERVKTTPTPIGQKYPIGTRVKIIAGDWHLGKLATVEHTHAHAFLSEFTKSYSLFIDGNGSSSWYDENSLRPI